MDINGKAEIERRKLIKQKKIKPKSAGYIRLGNRAMEEMENLKRKKESEKMKFHLEYIMKSNYIITLFVLIN